MAAVLLWMGWSQGAQWWQPGRWYLPARWLIDAETFTWLRWGLPLALALAPWGLRWLAKPGSVRRTPLDWPIWLFLASALLGLWGAYDREAGWHKFWLIVAGVFIFYYLAGQASRLWKVTAGFCGLGALLAGYLLLFYDWQAAPVKIAAINQLGLRWMALRPALPVGWQGYFPAPDADILAGVLAILAPFPAALAWRSARRGERGRLAGALLSGALILSALLLAGERGPWLGLLGVLPAWVVWRVAQHGEPAWRRTRWGRAGLGLFESSLAAGLALLVIVAWLRLDWVAALADRLPGPAQAGSRLHLASDAWRLVQDFPFTGGGLAAFPGLYSQYLKVIPYDYLENSHNLFLEVAVEQGLAGLLALIWLLVASAGLLAAVLRSAAGPEMRALAGAGLAGLLALTIHGLVENALYNRLDVPFLFILPGFAVAVHRAQLAAGPVKTARYTRPTLSPRGLAVVGVVLVLGAVIFGRVGAGAAVANGGALRMSRVELAGFPTGQWREAAPSPALAAAEADFELALRLDGSNRTALHRLGLIAMQAGRYQAAVHWLELAYRQDPGHLGIRKSLGYSFAWLGEIDRAAELLAPVDGILEELWAYETWWSVHERPDLSQAARQVAQALRAAGQP